MKLIGGPYNNRGIEDGGCVILRMCLYDGGERVGAKTGVALYEPSEDRNVAFWLDNEWLGTIEAIIPNDNN